MTRKVAFKQIPQVPCLDSPALTDFLVAVKQRLEIYQGNIGSGSDVILRSEFPDLAELNVNADWNSISGDSLILNKPTLGTAASRDAEGVLTDGFKLPDGHAIIEYGKANWKTCQCDNIQIGTQTIESNPWNAITVAGSDGYNFCICDLTNSDAWISCYRNLGVLLYYNGDKKLETTADGVKVTGYETTYKFDDPNTYTMKVGPQVQGLDTWQVIQISGPANFSIYDEDNSKSMIGAYRGAVADGVILYHDGNQRLKVTDAGVTFAKSGMTIDYDSVLSWNIVRVNQNGVAFVDNVNAPLTDSIIEAKIDGVHSYAQLWYDGVKKLQTTSAGVEITEQIKILGGSPGANKVLTSDAAGLGTWQTPSSGGCQCDNILTGTQTLQSNPWNAITVGSDNVHNFTIADVGNSEPWISCYRNQGVLIYYNGVKKLETTSVGIEVSGTIDLPDGERILLGASDQMRIGAELQANKHGIAIYSGLGFYIVDSAYGSMIEAKVGAESSLWYNKVRKLQTTSSGIEISGQVKITGGSPGANKVLTSDGAGLGSWQTPSAGSCQCDNILTGTQTLQSNPWNAITVGSDNAYNFTIADVANSDPWISCYRNQGVLIYYNGVKKLETVAGGIKTTGYNEISNLGITTKIGPQTVEAVTCHAIQISGAANFSIYDEDNSKAMIGAYRNAGVLIYYNGDKKLETISDGVKIPDNEKLTFGAGIKIEYVSVGTYSKVTVNQGGLSFMDSTGGSLFECKPGAESSLWYNKVRKLQTTLSGIDVAGTVKITGGSPGSGKVLTSNASGLGTWQTPSSGGDVTGPGSSTNNAICRFNSTTGKVIQNSSVTLSDTGVMDFGNGKVLLLGNSDQMRIGAELQANKHGIAIHSGTGFYVVDSTHNSMIEAKVGAESSLWHNHARKLQTTSSGVDIAGNIVVSGNVDGKDISSFGTAVSRNAEDTMTDGSNLPDGHAIKTYGDANWGGGGGLDNVVEDLTPQLGGNLDLNSKTINGTGTIDLPDGERILLGASDQMRIGVNIVAGYNAIICNSGIFTVAGPGAAYEQMLECNINGESSLWYNGIKKLKTTNVGVYSEGEIELPNNKQIKCGSGMKLEYNSTYSWGTILANQNGAGFFQYGTGPPAYSIIEAKISGGVSSAQLFYGGNRKLYTTNTGITVIGSCTGCDYVFEEDYKLMPLDDLRDYIDENKFLPNMTINKGTEIDFNNLRQESIEKIEELFSYILQLHKRTKILEDERGC